MSAPDFTEVFRKAHELTHTHGALRAFAYAARQAEQALAKQDLDEHEFWKAVAGSLEPR